jgi:putative nucleotidyltransferase with HDIG domain/PAS domain S-box-containing protein
MKRSGPAVSSKQTSGRRAEGRRKRGAEATARRHAEAKLRALSARQEALLAAIPEIVTEVDRHKVYAWANKAGLDFFGDDMIGREAAFYFEGEQDTYAKVEPLFRGDENTIYVESWQRRKDGQKRLLAWWCRTLKDSRGRVIGALSSARDITEQRRAEDEQRASYAKIRQAVSGAINALGLMAETRDPYTSGHQQRVAELAVAIASELGLPEGELETLHVAGILHDIGKVSVPSEILSKPTTLNEIEFCLLRNHSQVGFEIVKTLNLPWAIEKIVLQHHERLDGSGYPNGLRGREIEQGARIMAVADVVEAMVSHRPYRPALGLETALNEISSNKGTLYDPEVVEACLKLFREKGFRLEERA